MENGWRTIQERRAREIRGETAPQPQVERLRISGRVGMR